MPKTEICNTNSTKRFDKEGGEAQIWEPKWHTINVEEYNHIRGAFTPALTERRIRRNNTHKCSPMWRRLVPVETHRSRPVSTLDLHLSTCRVHKDDVPRVCGHRRKRKHLPTRSRSLQSTVPRAAGRQPAKHARNIAPGWQDVCARGQAVTDEPVAK